MKDVEQEWTKGTPFEPVGALAPFVQGYTEIKLTGTNEGVDGEDGVYGIK